MLYPSQPGSARSITVKQPLPTLTGPSIEYTRRQLLTRAGVDPDTLPLLIHYDQSSTPLDSSCVVVQPCAPDAWDVLLKRAPDTLHWIPASEVIPSGAKLPFDDPVPVLFWGAGIEDGDKPFAELRPDGTVIFYADIIAAAFFMLSRWEEMVVPTRDQHDRFPATASVAYKQGFLDSPIVDEYALILRAWLKVLRPNWQPVQRKFRVKLSHDIDFLERFSNPLAGIKTFGGDLIKRRDPQQAIQSLKDIFWQYTNPERNSHAQAVLFLAELSKQYGLDSAFYFMAAKPGDPFSETGYDPETDWIKNLIRTIQTQGFEVGLHPSYSTLNNPERLAQEKEILDRVLGHSRYGGRQHFLRFQAPDTWQHWEQAGLAYDATMTYADQEGFRCGTCHPYKPFDIQQNRELNLQECPLVVMEGSLLDYQNMTTQQAKKRIQELANKCKQVEGVFTFLWHNSSFSGVWKPWTEVYLESLAYLSRLSGSAP